MVMFPFLFARSLQLQLLPAARNVLLVAYVMAASSSSSSTCASADEESIGKGRRVVHICWLN